MFAERLWKLLAEMPAARRYIGRHRAPEPTDYAGEEPERETVSAGPAPTG